MFRELGLVDGGGLGGAPDVEKDGDVLDNVLVQY
jgi:hypothetical protein